MNLKSCTDVSATRKKLEVEVDGETFAKACDKAYRKNVSRLNVPGFRKGKAPKSMIEKMYGKEFFYEDAVNEIYPEALEAAIEEAGLKFVDDKIDLDVTEVGEDGLTFTAEITVLPEVTLSGDYKGIKATRPSSKVSDEDVEAEIERKRQQSARLVPVEDRAAEKGDTAEFDFEGFVDGVAFEGGKAENYSLELGSGNFIPGFEDQMIGHSAGEEFDVNVTFPEEYHAEELAGKDAVFKIKLHSLKKRELPEVDDDWAAEVSEFDTIAEYKDSIRADLTKKAEDKANGELDDAIIEELISLISSDIPDAMIEHRIDYNVREFEYRLRSQGLNIDDYMRYLNMTMDDIREQVRDNSEKQVKMRLAMEYVADKEGITVSDEELEAEFDKLAEQYKMEKDAIKKAINADDLRGDLAVEKAIAFVRENAEITDSEE